MLDRSGSMMTIAVAAAAVGAGILVPITRVQAQAPAVSGTMPMAVSALKTPWGEPDLQGIWTAESDTPLQRPARYASQEFFTEAQRAELDQVRADLGGKDVRAERGTERDVGGSYNQLFVPRKRTGTRTSMVVDPPDGRIPQLTPEAQKWAAAERAFRLALIRSTETCKSKYRNCAGGTYDPTPSPRLAELAPRYNTGGMNRHDGPEDHGLGVRCLAGGMPEFASISFRRIVQTPGGITMFYDVGQGQGFQRNIVMDGRPHLPSNIRQWYGDLRGHWEGNTLVVDVTNFSSENRFPGRAGELASGRALDADEPDQARLCGHDRGSDRVGAAVDRQAGVHPAERGGKPHLLRAALHRRKLCTAGADARRTHGRDRLRRGARSQSGDQRQHHRGFGRRG